MRKLLAVSAGVLIVGAVAVGILVVGGSGVATAADGDGDGRGQIATWVQTQQGDPQWHGLPYLLVQATTNQPADCEVRLRLLDPTSTELLDFHVTGEDGCDGGTVEFKHALEGYPSQAQFTIEATYLDAQGGQNDIEVTTFTKP